MRLKNLIEELSYKQVFNEIYAYYLKSEENSKVMEHDNAFYLAWNNLSKVKHEESEYREVNNCRIYLLDVAKNEKDCICEDYIDVCLYDEEDDEFFAADFQPWEHLISKEILTAINLSREQIMAHILWEITFWGYSSERVKEAGRSFLNE